MEDEKLLEEMENKEGFFHNNDYHIIKNEKEDIVIKVNITPNSLNPYGSAHGGLIFGLGDTVMGIIAYNLQFITSIKCLMHTYIVSTC